MNSCSTYILPQTPADNCQLFLGRANVRDKTIVVEIQPEGVPTDVGANNYLPILVIQTNEELEIARQTIRVIEKERVRGTGGSIMGRGEKFFAPTEKHRRRSIRLKGYVEGRFDEDRVAPGQPGEIRGAFGRCPDRLLNGFLTGLWGYAGQDDPGRWAWGRRPAFGGKLRLAADSVTGRCRQG